MTGATVAGTVELAEIFAEIGPNAQTILLDQARGLRKGKAYGDFDDDRDRVKEAAEEARDGVTYLDDALRRTRIELDAAIKSGDAKPIVALANRIALLKQTREAFRSAQRLLLKCKKLEGSEPAE
jgi:hypothetical protein